MSAPEQNGDLYIGLMSGTSMDGIDAAVVEFGDHRCQVLATHRSSYPAELRDALMTASRNPANCSIDDIGDLDVRVGECFREATLELLRANAIDPATITATGSHGQTLRHRPDAERPYTLQIGDPNIIAAGTGITTVADFRRRDVADGGQGAPLAPVFHQWLFSDNATSRCVLNIGGIANVTSLPAGGGINGFDTGPGNTLLDGWNRKHRGTDYDANGDWSASGKVIPDLLHHLLKDPYFAAGPPKSTGFEHFNLDWLAASLDSLEGPDPADVQATLCELTATTIADAIKRFAGGTEEILVCGGGVHNADLVNRLAGLVAPASVASTATHGLEPDWVEAAAFAWLAMRTLSGKTGNDPAVTGSSRKSVLGAIYR